MNSLKTRQTSKPSFSPITIHYLAQSKKPTTFPLAMPDEGLQIIRIKNPPLAFYRFLYNSVGEPWFWYERRLLNDQQLLPLLHHPDIHLYVLYQQGLPIGYAEISFKSMPHVDLVYFGLMPWALGKGLGRWLLDWCVHYSWSFNPEKILVNTCTLDHPKALSTYLKAGFKQISQEEKILDMLKIEEIMNQSKSYVTDASNFLAKYSTTPSL